MKKIKLTLLNFATALVVACNTLDVPPPNVLADADVFGSADGIRSYMANLYASMPLADSPEGEARSLELDSYAILANSTTGAGLPSDSKQGWWNYDCIRAACYFLQEFPRYRQNYDDVFADAWMGEARFIRAFCYFRMVQCYGGVPIIDAVPAYPAETDAERHIARATEQECYNFIIRDLNEAARLLPPASMPNFGLDKGRANKYAALALKARVALHAGCIARYGSEILKPWDDAAAVRQGMVGIQSSKAVEYFNLAWEAAKEVENSGMYSLCGAEPADENAAIINFRSMYLPAAEIENHEFIFAKYYRSPYNAHRVNNNCLPAQLGGRYAGQVNPTMEFVALFDDVDGKRIDWNARFGNDANYGDHLWENPADAFADLEPRFKAMILYPGARYKNEIVEIRKGILERGKFVAGAPFGGMDDVAVSSLLSSEYVSGFRIQGASGIGNYNTTSTGFYCVKYLDESLTREQATADPPRGEATFPEIRYAEVLLTLAEAAVELNRPDDAIPYMNAIRRRAGSHKTFSSVTLDDVRRERRMEFIWEGKTFRDLRRWRIFHREFDNTSPHVLWPIYVWDCRAYYMRIVSTGISFNYRVTFNPKFYYMRIPQTEIVKNGKLLPNNPGYSG